MSYSFQNTSMIKINIHFYPGDERLIYNFDNNNTFEDLKNKLNEQCILTKGTYYFEVDDEIMDDHMILKDKGVINNSCICAVDNNCIKIKLELDDYWGNLETIQCYVLMSDFKMIAADENKEVVVCNDNI